MAYWWRRRRWPWRRRWRRWRRRRRVPRRRYRRPVRRYRKRYTVRRRRRRRGWRGRRRRRLYRRRATIRRKRRTLVIRQWQPNNIRKCRIRGLLPMLICGHGNSANNYAIRSDDTVPTRTPFGGGLSTVHFSLKVLYDQHLRGLNRWSTSNDILDLARYNGCTFWFYRDLRTDYIVQYNITTPFTIDKDSSPSYHPGMLMQTKHKILVPSYDTHPRGKPKIRVRIPPPKMFIDKWYAQNDLCEVPLVTFVVSLASFTHPFCPPLTENPCITFQVLQNFYNSYIGYNINNASTYENIFKDYLYKEAAFYQQVLVSSYIKKIDYNPDGSPTSQNGNTAHPTNQFPSLGTFNTWVTTGITNANGNHNGEKGKSKKFITGHTNVHFNFCTYNPNIHELTTLRRYYFHCETAQSVTTKPFDTPHVPQHYTRPTHDNFEYRIGAFSPIFLSPFRTSPIENWPMAYRDISYNPLNDKGVGNKIWYQSITKQDTQFTLPSCTFVLEDKPLWAMCYGYRDFIKSTRERQDIDFDGLVCIISPYTVPPLYDKDHTQTGFVVYDSLFGNGKWLDGSGFIPVEYQCRWRVCLAFQQQVLTDIAMTGPFSYKDDYKNTCIQAKYKFNFRWGGNMLYQQTIKNPCTDGHPTDSHREPRSIQVSDPLTVGPRYCFHQWDWRRGFLGDKALKRMLQKPLDFELYPVTPKRPRIFPPTEGEQESQRQERSSSSEEESILISQEEKVPTEALQVHLRKQLRQQRELRFQLKHLFHQLCKTQAGLHLNPLLFTQQ
nr:MAG: ORF1 [Torque teno virus]